MRYSLLTLIVLVTTCAIVFAFLLRPDPIAKELRRDLNVPSTSQVWVIDGRSDNNVVAVTETDGAYKLFNAFRFTESGTRSQWFISFVILDVPPAKYAFKFRSSLGPNLKGPDVAQTYDHFPTEAEIENFVAAHRIDLSK